MIESSACAPIVSYGNASASVSVLQFLGWYLCGEWLVWHISIRKILRQSALFRHINKKRTQCFAPAVQCCAQNFRVVATSAHHTALLSDMENEKCTLRAQEVRTPRNSNHPVCRSGVQRITLSQWACMQYNARAMYTRSALTGTLCLCSVHLKCTHRCTVNLQCKL